MTIYIIKSSLSLLLLFGLYWFLLRKEKLFRFNRFFLIFSVIFSLVIPLIAIPVHAGENKDSGLLFTAVNSTIEAIEPQTELPVMTTGEFLTPASQYPEVKRSPVDLIPIIITIYLAGFLIFLVRFIRNILFISTQINRSEKLAHSGYTLALTDQHVNPYSFFRTIVVNKNDYHNDKITPELLQHEIEHIRQMHSIDIIFFEVIRMIYWFNPLIFLYNSAVRMNHEYLADSGVLNEPSDIRIYAETLIGFICYQNNVRLTSGFNPSLTRKRLLMLTRSNPGKTGERIRIMITVSAVVFVFLMISCIKTGAGSMGQVKDIDGNVYKTVTLGKQEWMAENLKTTRYNDGEMIPLVTDSVTWQNYEPAFCWYNNDEAVFKDKYGALYNWYAVNTDKLCPAGWHVPDMIEFWMILPDYLENNGYGLGASGKEIAKALASNTGWRPDTSLYNIGTDPASNNTSGFTAIPSGIRTYNGEYGDDGEFATWWSSNEYNEFVGKSFSLVNYYSRIMPFWPSKRAGFSVRCLKNITDPRDYADFTGNWEMNLQKSSKPSNLMAQTLSIIHTEDKITLQHKMPMITMGFDDGKYSYILNGEESIDLIDSTRIYKRAASWSPGRQSFIVKSTTVLSHDGKTYEIFYYKIYFMVDNGRSLVEYNTTSWPSSHYFPPEDTEGTTYYDRR
ncbi:MAG: FISUMP domain-containing protein [Bacteroidota bacterium]